MLATNLAEQLEIADRSYQELETTNLSSIDLEYINKANQCLLLYSQIQQQVVNLHLFSSNEMIDDINTNDLKYLKVLGMIALCHLKLHDNRKQKLVEATRYTKLFLDFLEIYAFDINNDKQPNRDLKMQEFRKQKEFKSRLLSLDRSSEEGCREYELIQLELLLMQVKSEHWDIQREMEMIEYKEQMEQDSRMMKKQNEQEQGLESKQFQKEKPKALLTSKGKVLQPFTITTERLKREELQNGVFRPGHVLPTMTIEEYLDREMERGNFLSGGTEPNQKQEIDDNDEEAIEKETFRLREFDNFTDFNPRGWGNRYRKG